MSLMRVIVPHLYTKCDGRTPSNSMIFGHGIKRPGETLAFKFLTSKWGHGSRVIDFLPAKLELAKPFHSRLRVRNGTDTADRQTTAINALCPTLGGGRGITSRNPQFVDISVSRSICFGSGWRWDCFTVPFGIDANGGV